MKARLSLIALTAFFFVAAVSSCSKSIALCLAQEEPPTLAADRPGNAWMIN